MSLLVALSIIILCLLMEAFFSGSEVAIISYDRIKLRHKVEKKENWAKIISHFIAHPGKLLGTTLLGTNISVICGSTAATIYVIFNYGQKYELIAFFIMSPLILFFGEILPKVIARQYSLSLTPLIAFPISLFSYVIFAPFVIIINIFTNFLNRLMGARKITASSKVTKDDLDHLIHKSHKTSDVERHEAEMIKKILQFSKKTVENIMIPLVGVEALKTEASVEDAMQMMLKSGFSRIPVYTDKVINIIGIVHTFDIIFKADKSEEIGKYLSKVDFIPESYPIDKLLYDFQKAGSNIAIIVDEYGTAVGIVTMEDILEEVVGEIEDEYDIEENLIKRLGTHKYLVNCRIEIDKFNELLPFTIEEGDYETLAGFILYLLNRIPANEEEFAYGNLKFKIKKASLRAIEEVIITLNGSK
ncbi:MAG: hemolysin family protein [Pseudomonadota bacterium]